MKEANQSHIRSRALKKNCLKELNIIMVGIGHYNIANTQIDLLVHFIIISNVMLDCEGEFMLISNPIQCLKYIIT